MTSNALTGTRIRERRLTLGVRQADLAREVGISPSYLNLIEHNRRRIGGKLLVDLARRLDVETSALTEGAEAALLEALHEAAAGSESTNAELQRVEEFAGRFPGWAQLLSDRHRRVGELERIVEMMTDRMSHDPFLTASLHEILSTVTAIRSTSAILFDTEDIAPEWRHRFNRNIHDEAQRLTDGAQALVNYLGDSGGQAGWQNLPREEVEAYLLARDYHLPELETGSADIGTLVDSAAQLTSDPARDLARAVLERYARDAAQLPQEGFVPVARNLGYDPNQLALHFSTDLATVFRRLANLPERILGVRAGLVMCDGSGALTYRKAAGGQALPRFGVDCPLWPLYQALSRPMAPIRAELEQAGDPPQRYQSYAICQPVQMGGLGDAQVLESSMLILPAAQTALAEQTS